MAVGPYAFPGEIGEHKLDNLLATYNQVVSSTGGVANLWSQEIDAVVNASLFADTPRVPYQSDSSTGGNVSLTGGINLFLEYGSTGSNTIDFTTNGESAVVVLGPSNSLNFDDKGSSGDTGDVIVGSNAAQNIWIDAANTGKNTVVAGSGRDNIYGGSVGDRLIGGGNSSLTAGTGKETLIAGFYTTSKDTLVGGSGADVLKTKFGSNLIVAGSGAETIKSGMNTVGAGPDYAGAVKDSISLTNGGAASVSIAENANDSVTYSGGGNDTLSVTGSADVTIHDTLTGISSAGGVTTLTFADGTLSYEGTGSITLHFT